MSSPEEEPDCVICLDPVLSSDAVHQCSRCFLLSHLPCAQRAASAELSGGGGLGAALAGGGASFSCPHCRSTFPRSAYPSRATCFCGSVVDPPPDAWLPPHSCGGVCGRPRGCGHACVEQCHGGPCSPCLLSIDAACPCGRTRRRLRCGGAVPPCGAP